MLCQNQEGFPCEQSENKEQGTEMFTSLCWEPALHQGTGAKMQNHAGVPAPRSSACWEIRLYCSQQGVNAESWIGFSFLCNLISPAELGVLGLGGAGSGSSLDSPDIISLSSGLALQDWASSHKKTRATCSSSSSLSVFFLYLGYHSSSQRRSIGSLVSFNL